MAAIAAASGPTVGGLLVAVDWRLIFLINVPIGAATLLVGRKVLPEIRAERGSRLPDPLSGIALFATVVLLTFAMVKSSTWGWTSAGTILLMLAALAAGVLTVRRSLTHPRALVEASLFRSSREFSAATAGLFVFYLAFAAWLLITVLFLQNVWHYDAVRTGLAIVPGPAAAAVFALNAGRITGRFGRRTPAIVGTLLFAAGSLFWLLATPADPCYLTGFLPGLLIAGAGAGMTQAPLFATASTLPADRATTGSAVLNVARQVGSAVGVAILVTLLPDTGSLTDYRHGWLFMLIACLASTVAVSLSAGRGTRIEA